MDERSFAAELGEVGDLALDGDAVAVSFVVAANYRTSFGQNRDRTLSFLGRFARQGSEWQLASCALQPGGP